MGDPTRQHHDWEPGIAQSGLFWTIPIPASAINVDPGSGQARLHATSLPLTDYHDFFNAVLGGGPTPIPSHATFDIHWSGNGDRTKIRDNTFGFLGEYTTGNTTITFTTTDDNNNVTYTSDPTGQYNPTPAQGGAGSPAVGHERNGVFFH